MNQNLRVSKDHLAKHITLIAKSKTSLKVIKHAKRTIAGLE